VSEPRPVVFVVDDDPSVRRALDRLLRSEGYPVMTFASARDVLEHADFGRAGCLVLDVRMPGQSGLDLYEVVTMSGHDVPVVFITGHGDVPMAVQAMKAGAVDFLTKPFEDRELLDAVGRAFSRDRRGGPHR
jgi:FixJ family two-component response regulator